MQSAVCAVVTFILACVVIVFASDFGYGVQHGPDHWTEDYERCSGKHQSPINIDRLHIVRMPYPDIKYTNFDVRPKAIHMTNNGHTVLVTMNFTEGKEPRMFGGPLDAINADYQFEQFHFHWGENDTVGSEDMINNQQFPAEMHVVMRCVKYKDLPSALEHEYGIAVLAFFFKVNAYNPYYGEFVEMLSLIDQKGRTSDLAQSLPLLKFLPTNSLKYYSYIGSLTTPPCTEKVIWIDYQEPIEIGEYQLNLFRKLTANNDQMRNNFRPIQPLNDRLIYENIPNPKLIYNNWISLPSAAGSIDTGSVAMMLLGCSLVLLPQAQYF